MMRAGATQLRVLVLLLCVVAVLLVRLNRPTMAVPQLLVTYWPLWLLLFGIAVSGVALSRR